MACLVSKTSIVSHFWAGRSRGNGKADLTDIVDVMDNSGDTKNTGGYNSKLMAAKVDSAKCAGSGACVEACPVEAIKLVDNKAVVDADECTDCGACVDECPNKAITLD